MTSWTSLGKEMYMDCIISGRSALEATERVKGAVGDDIFSFYFFGGVLYINIYICNNKKKKSVKKSSKSCKDL